MNTEKFSLESFPFLNFDVLRSRISWSIRLRWVAVLCFYSAVLVAKDAFDLNVHAEKVGYLLGGLALLNLIYYSAFKIIGDVSFRSEMIILAIHIALDLLVLTYLIHLTGGIDNPIYLFYIFHVVLSSFVFPRWIPFVVATLTIFLLSTLIWLEYSGYIPHYCIYGTDIHLNKFIIFLILAVFSITAYITTYICMTFMKIYRDMKRQVDHRNEQLETLSREKASIFRFTSHELKSPIIAVKSSIDSVCRINEKSMDKKSFDLLKRASARSSQMLEIINELLEVSNSQNSAEKINDSLVDLSDLIKMVTNDEISGVEEKNIKIDFRLPENSLMVKGDIDDFRKVFVNLVNNAIRYSNAEGQVTLSGICNKAKIIIKIKDEGIGIPSEDLEKIFTEFYRSKNARDAINFGTGLGLSLVKNIVEKYQGSIKVSSQVGKGSEFVVELPAALNNSSGVKK